MSCIINMVIRSDGSQGEIASTVFSFLIFVSACPQLILEVQFGMMGCFIYLTYLIFKRRDELDTNESLKKKIGAFYEDARTDSTLSLLYTPIFVFRRLLFASLLLSCGEFQIFQVIMMIISTASYLVYLILVKPYDDPVMNRLGVINESFVFVTAFMIFPFANQIYTQEQLESVETAKMQMNIGWFLIAWINTIAAGNMLYSIYKTINELYKEVKKIYIERILKRG